MPQEIQGLLYGLSRLSRQADDPLDVVLAGVLGKDEDAASFVKKIEEAKKAIGGDYFTIINENCLWQAAGKDQMLNVIAELLKAKYPTDELASLFSGAFLRALSQARRS